MNRSYNDSLSAENQIEQEELIASILFDMVAQEDDADLGHVAYVVVNEVWCVRGGYGHPWGSTQVEDAIERKLEDKPPQNEEDCAAAGRELFLLIVTELYPKLLTKEPG